MGNSGGLSEADDGPLSAFEFWDEVAAAEGSFGSRKLSIVDVEGNCSSGSSSTLSVLSVDSFASFTA